MLNITNKENLKIIYDDPRPGDILHSYADISLAQKLLKYRPDYNQEQGLKDYFNWFSRKYKVELNVN